MRAILLALLIASCGGQSSAQPDSTGPRPVRVESEEAEEEVVTTRPVRVEGTDPATADEGLTSDELADPPPIEPP